MARPMVARALMPVTWFAPTKAGGVAHVASAPTPSQQGWIARAAAMGEVRSFHDPRNAVFALCHRARSGYPRNRITLDVGGIRQCDECARRLNGTEGR